MKKEENRKTVKAVYWYTIDIMLNRGAYFFTTLYVARMIGPTEFGLASILTVVYYLGLAISDGGMSNSLLRSKHCDDKDYGTVFLANIFFGVVIYSLLVLFTPFIATFYKAPKLISVLPIYSLGIILSSFKSVHIAYLMKNFDYKRMFILNMPGGILSIVVTVYLTKVGAGVWSVVALFLVNQLVSFITFVFFSGWKTSFKYDKSSFKKHFYFGYKISIASFINTFFENLYQLLIGKYFSIRMTGIFDRAFSLGNYPVSILSTVFSRVTLPLFAEMSDDIASLKQKLKESVKLVFFVSCYVVSTLILVVPYFISTFLGHQWDDAINIFKILCIGLVLYPIHTINLNVLNVFGRSDLLLKLEVIKKALQIILILLSYKLGIMGLILSFVLLSVSSFFINSYYAQKYVGYNIYAQIKDLLPNLLFAFICLKGVNLFEYTTAPNITIIVLETVVFSFLYYLFSFFFNRAAFVYIKGLATPIIKKAF